MIDERQLCRKSEPRLFAEIISDEDFRRGAVVERAIMARHARAINALLRAPPTPSRPYRRHAAVVIVLFGFNYSPRPLGAEDEVAAHFQEVLSVYLKAILGRSLRGYDLSS